jgi:hypothetical protein
VVGLEQGWYAVDPSVVIEHSNVTMPGAENEKSRVGSLVGSDGAESI